MKSPACLTAYQLYAISRNEKLVKDIRKTAATELDIRMLSTEEHNVIAEKHRSLSGGEEPAKNKTGIKFFFLILCLLLPPAVFLSSKIALCVWSGLFAGCNSTRLRMQQRILTLYTWAGFALWTIIVMIAGKYLL